jgi:hypothetical protein
MSYVIGRGTLQRDHMAAVSGARQVLQTSAPAALPEEMGREVSR